MGKQRVYTGAYTKCHPSHFVSSSRSNREDIQTLIFKYLRTMYSAVISSYLPIVTVIIVLILSLFLPNKSNKNNELEVMKTVLNHMTKEVDRAEVACLTAANEVHCLHSSVCNEETETNMVPIKPFGQLSFSHGVIITETNFIPIVNVVIRQIRELRDLSVCTSRALFSTKSEPVQMEKKIGIFRRIFPQRNISRKEIAIMSIVYTDSFDSQNRLTGI